MCPDTCGVCSSVNSTACVDVTDCQNLIQNDPDYCKSQNAVLQCSKACNLCEKLIDSILLSILQTNTGTNQPAAMTTPTSAVNCEDLNNVTCDHLAPMCIQTFLNVLCPDRCNACF
ncbi:uncharacterized protein ZK643.6-like [Aplysia californica]|uniref:Uncharacterized protein ZK643.6-like n=1 Tax=Aplysia californica TaxID=6500 RepID=A0ABM1A9F0_APLCA|nr:uncharacterized protein ZK643.6-like [Aplysia californica]